MRETAKRKLKSRWSQQHFSTLFLTHFHASLYLSPHLFFISLQPNTFNFFILFLTYFYSLNLFPRTLFLPSLPNRPYMTTIKYIGKNNTYKTSLEPSALTFIKISIGICGQKLYCNKLHSSNYI